MLNKIENFNFPTEASKMVEDYPHYKELGGVLDEEEYEKILLKVEEVTEVNAVSKLQAENIARTAGIELQSENGNVDKRVALYVMLRTDPDFIDGKHDFGKLCDQQLFAEVLKIFGDSGSLKDLKSSHPEIFHDEVEVNE